MAGPSYYDRVKDTSTTTGTGTLTLANSAPTGFRTFGSVLANGDLCFYAIVGGAEWEVGIGTYTTSGTTLARTKVLASSNSNAAVNFSSGTKDVFITHPASQFEWQPKITPPIPGDFSNVAPSTGTVTRTITDGGVHLKHAVSSGYYITVDVKTAPATPYNIDMLLLVQANTRGNIGFVGPVWRDSSGGKLIMASLWPGGSTSFSWMLAKFDGLNNAYNSNYASSNGYVGGNLYWCRFRDDGTSRKIYQSVDGLNWDELHSVGRTDFLTANQVGWGVNGYSYDNSAKLISWKES